MEFNKVTCRAIRADIYKALEEVEKKYGVVFNREVPGRYSPTTFGFKLEAIVADSKDDMKEQLFNKAVHSVRGSKMVGMYGKHFRDVNGVRYTVCEYHLRRSRYPVVAYRETDGARFKFSESDVYLNIED